MDGTRREGFDELSNIGQALEISDDVDGCAGSVRAKDRRRTVSELLAEILPRQRVLRIAPRRLDDAGVLDLADGVNANDGVAADWELRSAGLFDDRDSFHQLLHVRPLDRLVGEGGEADSPVDESSGDAVLHTELALETSRGEIRPKRHQRPSADRDPDAADIGVVRGALGTPDLEGSVYSAVGRVTAGVELDADARRDDLPRIAKSG